jgi:hypothetical protein
LFLVDRHIAQSSLAKLFFSFSSSFRGTNLPLLWHQQMQRTCKRHHSWQSIYFIWLFYFLLRYLLSPLAYLHYLIQEIWNQSLVDSYAEFCNQEGRSCTYTCKYTEIKEYDSLASIPEYDPNIISDSVNIGFSTKYFQWIDFLSI